MKVILSVDSVRFPLTGIGRYTYELATQFKKVEGLDIKFFSGFKFLSEEIAIPDEQAGAYHFIKKIAQRSNFLSDMYRVVMPVLKYKALKGFEDYIFHGPNFFLPPFAGRRIATFHDLSPFTWPQCNTPQRIRFTQKELIKTLERADALITDSNFTRQELANYFSWPIEKIYSVPLASSSEFYPRSTDVLISALSKYNLKPGGYTLFVGTIEPRKNLLALLDAYSRLPFSTRMHWPLIISGYQGWRSDLIHERIAVAERQGWARYIGFTAAKDLPYLFAGAHLFAFPSLYEGFGLPVLEAMASGIPTVCSNAASLPEIVDGVALMSSPEDIFALTENLARGIEDDDWRLSSRNAGLCRAQSFSWRRCAEETLEVYKKVIES